MSKLNKHRGFEVMIPKVIIPVTEEDPTNHFNVSFKILGREFSFKIAVTKL